MYSPIGIYQVIAHIEEVLEAINVEPCQLLYPKKLKQEHQHPYLKLLNLNMRVYVSLNNTLCVIACSTQTVRSPRSKAKRF
jgi:hypothetical protein